MNKLLTIFTVIFLILIPSAGLRAMGTLHLVSLTTEMVNGATLGVMPGDTIAILSGQRQLLYFTDIHGDSLHPVVIINRGGAVLVTNTTRQYGIRIGHSHHFRITGTGVDSIKYGIRIMQTAVNCNGLSLDNLSTNFEVDHLEIAHTGFAGINSKTQPTCDGTANRGVFTQYHVSIHHNYIHDTGGEGMYIGHTSYTGYVTTCSGVADTLYPHDIIGMRVFENVVENAGYDGIQVGCVTEDCEIYNNLVTGYGALKVESQNAGIQMGGGTTGKCYNNLIKNGSGIGITVFGTGNNLVYNNVIINAGFNYFPTNPAKFVHGIYCADRSTVPGRFFNFINNTIVNPKTDGIRFSSLLSSNNEIRNNIIVNPGSRGSYSNPTTCYINLMNCAPVTLSNNFNAPTANQVQFRDTVNNNYRIMGNSPACESGFDVSALGITFDADSLLRPFSGLFDVGAYEYHPENTWLGHKSSEWSDPENWSQDGLPLPGENVVIPSGTPFIPEISSGSFTCHHITVNEGGRLIINPVASLSIEGNLTIQMGGILTNDGTIYLKGNLANLN